MKSIYTYLEMPTSKVIEKLLEKWPSHKTCKRMVLWRPLDQSFMLAPSAVVFRQLNVTCSVNWNKGAIFIVIQVLYVTKYVKCRYILNHRDDKMSKNIWQNTRNLTICTYSSLSKKKNYLYTIWSEVIKACNEHSNYISCVGTAFYD